MHQTCRGSHSRTRNLAVSMGRLLRCLHNFETTMRSFRKRLLVLIIGLVIVTQTVTLAAVLASTRRTVEARSWEQLRSGAAIADQLVRFRAGQLANGVTVLAADFGFREAVASGHVPTILSAADNNAQRLGADVMLVLATHARVLASTVPADSGAA